MKKGSSGWGKRLLGLGILAITVGVTLALNHMGQSQQPSVYTLAFDHGTQLDDNASATLGRITRDAATRDDAAIIITGHTGTLGDTQANQALSARRAREVAQRLTDNNIDDARISAQGVAGKEPLTRTEDESNRAYQRRLARVEVTVRP